MKQALTITIAQCNFHLGQVVANTKQTLDLAHQAYQQQHSDCVVFPELSLTGYPPEDLLFRTDLQLEVQQALQHIAKEAPPLTIVVGHPHYIGGRLFNAASAIFQSKIQACYFKQYLPNYSVFDEKRYFHAGHKMSTFSLKGYRIALSICEDLWHDSPMQQAKAAGADMMLCLNASPFDHVKQRTRESMLAKQAQAGHMPIIYVQCVGGQDELVFDGGSMVLDALGRKQFQGDFFKTGLYPIHFPLLTTTAQQHSNSHHLQTNFQIPSIEQHIYQALCLGVKDYVNKNKFKSVILGLSGGIDSALSLAIAVDALGASRVHAVMLPSQYTSQLSLDMAASIANNFAVDYKVIPIEQHYQSIQQGLQQAVTADLDDLTLQNLQARIRAIILMALSNQQGHLLLSTSNKSETAMGYTTLYGDMAGGFCVLQDVFKTWVYRLANYRNQLSETTQVIPQAIIDRAPTAELTLNQYDQDSLPSYDKLDQILIRYLEQDECATTIAAAGFDIATVEQVIEAVKRSEYKRQQAPPGVKITTRAFGRDRRYPITR